MINFILQKIIGTQNERGLKKLTPIAEKISALEGETAKLSDAQLKAKTYEFKEKIKAKLSGYKKSELSDEELFKVEQEALAEIMPEAFAVVRETGKRTIDMRHFDVQLMGGVVLHEGKIAEMATGEGKTLVATLSVYLNALTGRGVHLITVNDYLAKRDSQWMGPIYEFLGLKVGIIQHDMLPPQRQEAYACDITYGTNNEFGFDYLRDNMVTRKEDMVQGQLHYAIVDEVDSILIDEARTPLIISGPTEESTDKYYKINRIVPLLQKGGRDKVTKQESGDYVVDEKAHTAYLTEAGELKAAQLLGISNLHDIDSMENKHHLNQALKAHTLFKQDVDYVIKEGEVIIVDEFTGRLMPGRRWSDGLHQAVEAKENVRIERENQTLATITFQNYFRMYKKLAGMTGTAATEAGEFKHIYKLDVVIIPTNQPLIRTNHPDVIYRTEKEKFKAVAEEIVRLHEEGRPVLVGTISIEKSELLSQMLKRKSIPHHVLNAKYHEMEAQIVAQAGRFKAVTIATNMAGRGTDIVLGGNAEFLAKEILKSKGIEPYLASSQEKEEAFLKVKEQVEKEHQKVVGLGGLHVLGTERHESRRIDNQLRGRSGRQGDPGSSGFYISLEDDLMRIFGSDKISVIMSKLGMEEGQDIQHPLVTRAIETAQKRVEGHNFEIRKQLLEFDNVMNKQREVIYDERRAVLEGAGLKDEIYNMIEEVIAAAVSRYLVTDKDYKEPNFLGLTDFIKSKFALSLDGLESGAMNNEQIQELIINKLKEVYQNKEKSITPEALRYLEQTVMLQVIDSKWKDHLYSMDNLREGIGLRAYGQRDPLVEYQHEGYEMFSQMIESIKEEVLEFVFKIQVAQPKKVASVFSAIPQEFIHPEMTSLDKRVVSPQKEKLDQPTQQPPYPREDAPTYKRSAPKVGRNDPCSCGSGKKYKKCCGK